MNDSIESLLTRGAWQAYFAGRCDLAPRIRRKPSQCATAVRRIASGTATMTNAEIAYDHAVMPHCVEPMDAADDPRIKTIVLWFAIREGKTLGVIMNIVVWKVHDNPCNIYFVFPIDPDVTRFSEGDLEPTIQACMEDYFVDKKSRDSGRTIYFKKYRGGWIRMVNAGSLTQFRGTNVGLMTISEADKVSQEAIAMAFGRTTGIPDAKVIIESTGTMESTFSPDGKEEYRSNIKEWFDKGTKKKWFCACRKCGYLQVIRYEQIRYPTGKMELARYHCEACDHAHTPAQWRAMAAQGKWYPTAGLTELEVKEIEHTHRRARPVDPSVDSYWRNAFTSLLPHSTAYKNKLHEFVAEGESAKSNIDALKIWTQEKKAELWSESREGETPPPWKPLFDAREDYADNTGRIIVPKAVVFVFCFIDVQDNRLEMEWKGWCRDEQSYGLAYTVLDGNPYNIQPGSLWHKAMHELERTFMREDGAPLALSMAFVDAGFGSHSTWCFEFYKLTRTRPAIVGKVMLSKGVGAGVINPRKMARIHRNILGIPIGTWAAKDVIYSRLRLQRDADGGYPSGYIHHPISYPEMYFQGLTAETVRVEFEHGELIRKYENEERKRNEPLDCAAGCLAIRCLRTWNFDAEETELLERAAEARGETPKEEKKDEPFAADLGGMRM